MGAGTPSTDSVRRRRKRARSRARSRAKSGAKAEPRDDGGGTEAPEAAKRGGGEVILPGVPREVAPSPGAQLASVAQGAALLLAVAMALRVIDALVNNPLLRAVFGAVLVSLVAGWIGLRGQGATAAARRRGGLGAVLVLAPWLAMWLLALLVGGQLFFAPPGLTVLFGAVESLAVAYRDELWLHGLVLLFAARAGVGNSMAALYAVAASAAVVALHAGLSAASVALVLASALLFVLLWLRTGDGWAPVAAHAAWLWGTESLLGGELFDVVSPAGRVAAGPAASGAPAWAAALSFAVLCVLLARGRIHLDRSKPLAH